jgi:DNA repair protein RadC
MDLSLSDEEKASLIKLARESTKIKPGMKIHNPSDTVDFLLFELSDKKNEEFGAILLDNRHRVLGLQSLFQGTINGASVHPRVVVQYVMGLNAAAVIFYHNHPSGDPEPSQADRQLTNRLKDVLNVIDVRTLDHFVIGSGEAVSFAERGFL